MKKSDLIIVSAINFSNGGPLTVLIDCLEVLKRNHPMYRIIALVHRKELIDVPGIELMEFPKSKKSWFFRIYYEYMHFRRLSAKLQPYLWIALHDISPNITAEKRVVYCHNPSPFYRIRLKDIRLDYRFSLFTLFYTYLFRINIKKNDWVIVQQQWLREEFRKKFNIENIIVAHPTKAENTAKSSSIGDVHSPGTILRFFYPAVPRVFKNFEVIADAVIQLNDAGITSFEVILTTDGSENNYAQMIFKKYQHIKNLRFVGYQTKADMHVLYSECDCILFPSRLETWGLPITEAKQHNKPILLADLPYARETLGKYDKAAFFSPDNHRDLAQKMTLFMQTALKFEMTTEVTPAAPFAKSWSELLRIIVNPAS